MQPTRLMSKTLIDNIFINSIDYSSFSANITIQSSDHLFQIVILQGFFKDLHPKWINLYERNFKNFNEREFDEEWNNMDWDSILGLDLSNPNTSMDNLYNHLVYMLNEYAPYKKISKKVLKQKYEEYKRSRNLVTNMKRDVKLKYYQEYFETHESKASYIWKGIKSIAKIRTSSKKDISLIDDKGLNVTGPIKIAKLFNNYFVNIWPTIDTAIPNAQIDFRDLKTSKSIKHFFLSPTIPEEIFKIIASLDKKKPLWPNSLPIYILKLYNNFFSENLAKIINLSFVTGIFPDLLKLAKDIPTFKKVNEHICENYRPII